MISSEMKKRLKKGEKAIDLTIEKWRDIVDKKGIDEGSFNCALCQIGKDRKDRFDIPICTNCPLFKYGTACGSNKSTYVTYSYKPTKKNAQAMVDELESVRRKMIKFGEY